MTKHLNFTFSGGFAFSLIGLSLFQRYLLLSMALQLIWSFCLMCVDICSLWKKLDLPHLEAVWPIVIGDWVSVPFLRFVV